MDKSFLLFQAITVELSAQDDHSLRGFSHLVLEISSGNKNLDSVDLLSQESCPGVWHAKKSLMLPEKFAHFTLSVFAEVDEGRQLLASKQLYVSKLYDRIGEPDEILLDGDENYPNMILKTTVTTDIDFFMQILRGRQRQGTESEQPKNTNNHLLLLQLLSLLDIVEGSPTQGFNGFESPGETDSEIEQEQEAVSRIPDDDPDKSKRLYNLGNSLQTRFKRTGSMEDIDNAIERYQAAVDLTPDRDPDKPSMLNNLGNSLHARFKRLGKREDIDSAVKQLQAAVELTPADHTTKSIRLSNLGASLQTRFKSLGNLEDINNAIERLQTALNCTPDDHPNKSSVLNNLGTALQSRFERLGNLEDIDNAVKELRAATKPPDGQPIKPIWLSNLGDALRARFERLGNQKDIDSAIGAHQTAINLAPDGDPDKRSLLHNFGTSLQSRFKRLENLEDINNAIEQLQEAVDLTSDGDPDKPMSLSSLGISFCHRFEHLGNLEDIDNGIEQLQEAVSLTLDSHPDKPIRLGNLGTSLQARFERFGNLEDINNAIRRLQAAVELTPGAHPDRPVWLSNLGGSFLRRFERLEKRDDIDSAIEQLQQSVNLTLDDHPDKPLWLNNLGSAFLRRFESVGNLEDIDSAIQRLQEAINLTPNGLPHNPMSLGNLGISFCRRFKRLENPEDIDNSIERLEAAVKHTPDGHPDKPGRLNNLGASLLYRFELTGQYIDVDACIVYLSASALSPGGYPSIRLDAARNWIHAASFTKHPSLLDACECAINIIPLVAWLGLSIKDRHQHLTEIGGIVREAAAIAISLEQCEKALEWLEQGRSIVWTQILQLRTPVDQLRAVEPDLADRLLQISQLLDQGTNDKSTRISLKQSSEGESRRYRALAKERDAIIDKVRTLHNFQDFLRTSKVGRLVEASKNGPVVVVNVSEKRCDALALVYGADEVVHIPLPRLTSERVTELQVDLKTLLKSNGVRVRATRLMEVQEGGDEKCKQILAELWRHLVNPVLDSLAFSANPETLPRIWWCVTGPLAFLPIHAAGVYDAESSGLQTQDYSIVSYSPTISALLDPSDPPVHKPFRHLSVIEPSSGVSHIPNTEKEMECIRRRLQKRDHLVLHKVDATKDRVMKEMQSYNWLHLACHGIQNASNPTRSGLTLHDGKLNLEEIIRLDLPHAEFAFLSACQTMTGDENLSEEAAHIAGGMSLAGYRSVVATMWSIEDALAPRVADEFYARLLRDGQRPDNRKAAEALYFSVKKLREEEKDIKMLSWIPFVHLGI